MKILLINHRYFISGGPERYLFNLKKLLENNEHIVIPFSIKYSKNEYSEFSKYFVSSLGNEDEIYFREQTRTVKGFIRTLERTFYSREVFHSLSNLILDEKPDFAIVLSYLRKLSPAVLMALDIHRIPFFVRLSDFSMICPNGHLIRDDKICELCIRGDLFHSVRYKCVQNSHGISFINYLSTKYHRFMRYFDVIKYFAIPSDFTKMKMIEAGWDRNKLVHVPTLVFSAPSNGGIERKKQIIYVGRLERIKGIHILLEAYNKIMALPEGKNVPLLIVGAGAKEYVQDLQNFVLANGLSNVRFVGNLDTSKVNTLLRESSVSVAPSIWYDNMPNSVLESLSCGTAVIASDHGSFPEIVKDGEQGLLFRSNDPNDLALKILYLLKNHDICLEMGLRGMAYARTHHSPEKHYIDIMAIYDKLVNLHQNI